MEGSQTARDKWRPIKTIRETFKKDLEINELDRNMVFDKTFWRSLTQVADLT